MAPRSEPASSSLRRHSVDVPAMFLALGREGQMTQKDKPDNLHGVYSLLGRGAGRAGNRLRRAHSPLLTEKKGIQCLLNRLSDPKVSDTYGRVCSFSCLVP